MCMHNEVWGCVEIFTDFPCICSKMLPYRNLLGHRGHCRISCEIQRRLLLPYLSENLNTFSVILENYPRHKKKFEECLKLNS